MHYCRLERALEELGGYRKAAGRSTTPDFNEEDRLRADLHNSEAQKRQLGQDSQALANLVLNLAHKKLASQTQGTPGRITHSAYFWPWHIWCSTLALIVQMPGNLYPRPKEVQVTLGSVHSYALVASCKS